MAWMAVLQARGQAFQTEIDYAIVGYFSLTAMTAPNALTDEFFVVGGDSVNAFEIPAEGYLNVTTVFLDFFSFPAVASGTTAQVYLAATTVTLDVTSTVVIHRLSDPIHVRFDEMGDVFTFPVSNFVLRPGERMGMYNPNGALNIKYCTNPDTCGSVGLPEQSVNVLHGDLDDALDVIKAHSISEPGARFRMSFMASATRIRAEVPEIFHNGAAKQYRFEPFNITARSPLRNQSAEFAVKCMFECSATGGILTDRTVLTMAATSPLGGRSVANCSEVHNITATTICDDPLTGVAIVVSAQSFDVWRAPSPIVTSVIVLHSSSLSEPSPVTISAASNATRRIPTFPGRFYPEVVLTTARSEPSEPFPAGMMLLCAVTRGPALASDQRLLLDITEEAWRRQGSPTAAIIPQIHTSGASLGDSLTTPFLCSGKPNQPEGGIVVEFPVTLNPDEASGLVSLMAFARAVGANGTTSGQFADSSIAVSGVFELMPPRPLVNFSGANMSTLNESWLPPLVSFDAYTQASVVPMVLWNLSALPNSGDDLPFVDAMPGHATTVEWIHLQGSIGNVPVAINGVGGGPMGDLRIAVGLVDMPRLLLVSVTLASPCSTPAYCASVFALATTSDVGLFPDMAANIASLTESFPDGIDPTQSVPRIGVFTTNLVLQMPDDGTLVPLQYASHRSAASGQLAQFMMLCYFELTAPVLDVQVSAPPDFGWIANGSLPVSAAEITGFVGLTAATVTLPTASSPDLDAGRWVVCGKARMVDGRLIKSSITLARPGRYTLHVLFAPVPGTVEAILWKPGPTTVVQVMAKLALLQSRTGLQGPTRVGVLPDLVAPRSSALTSAGQGWTSSVSVPGHVAIADAAEATASTHMVAGGVYYASFGIPGASYTCFTETSDAVQKISDPTSVAVTCGRDDPLTGEYVTRSSMAVVKSAWPRGLQPQQVMVRATMPARMHGVPSLAAWGQATASSSFSTEGHNFTFSSPVSPILASPAFTPRLETVGTSGIDWGDGLESETRPGNATTLLQVLNQGRGEAGLPLLWFAASGLNVKDNTVLGTTRVVSASIPVQITATGIWPAEMRAICRVQQACIDGRRGRTGSVSFDQSMPCWHTRAPQVWVSCDGQPVELEVLRAAERAQAENRSSELPAVWQAALTTEALAWAQGKGVSGDIHAAFRNATPVALSDLQQGTGSRLATLASHRNLIDTPVHVYLAATNDSSATSTGVGIVRKGLFRVTSTVVDPRVSASTSGWKTQLPTASWIRGRSDLLVVARSSLPPPTVQVTSEWHPAIAGAGERARPAYADNMPTVLAEALAGVSGAPAIVVPALDAYVTRAGSALHPYTIDTPSGAIVHAGLPVLTPSVAVRAAVWEPWIRTGCQRSLGSSPNTPVPERAFAARLAVRNVSRQGHLFGFTNPATLTGHSILDSVAAMLQLRPAPVGSGLGLDSSAVISRNSSIPVISAFAGGQGSAASEGPSFLRRMVAICGANPSVLHWSSPFVMQSNGSVASYEAVPVSARSPDSQGLFACGEAQSSPIEESSGLPVEMQVVNPQQQVFDSGMLAGAAAAKLYHPSLLFLRASSTSSSSFPHTPVSASLPGAGVFRVAAVTSLTVAATARSNATYKDAATGGASEVTTTVDVSPTWDLHGGEPFPGAFAATNNMAIADSLCFKGPNVTFSTSEQIHSARLAVADACESVLLSSTLIVAPLRPRGLWSPGFLAVSNVIALSRHRRVYDVMRAIEPWSGVLRMANQLMSAGELPTARPSSPLQAPLIRQVRGVNSLETLTVDAAGLLDSAGVIGYHRHLFLDDLTYRSLFEAASASGQGSEWMPVNAPLSSTLPSGSIPDVELSASHPPAESGLSQADWQAQLATDRKARVPFALGVVCSVLHPYGMFPWFARSDEGLVSGLPVFRAFGVDCVGMWTLSVRRVQMLTQHNLTLTTPPLPSMSGSGLIMTTHQMLYGRPRYMPVSPAVALASAFEPAALSLLIHLVAVPDLTMATAMRSHSLHTHWMAGGIQSQDPSSWAARLDSIWQELSPFVSHQDSQPALAPAAVGGEGFAHIAGTYATHTNASLARLVHVGGWTPVDPADPDDLARRLLLTGASAPSMHGTRIILVPAPARLTLPTVVISGQIGMEARSHSLRHTVVPATFGQSTNPLPTVEIGFSETDAWQEELAPLSGAPVVSNITVLVRDSSRLTEIALKQPVWASSWHDGWAGVNATVAGASRLSGRTLAPNRTFLEAAGVGIDADTVTASFCLLPAASPSVCEETLEVLVPAAAAQQLQLESNASVDTADMVWTRVRALQKNTTWPLSIAWDRYDRSVDPDITSTSALAVDVVGWILTSMPLDLAPATAPRLRCIPDGQVTLQVRLDAIVQQPDAWVPGRAQELKLMFTEFPAPQRELIAGDVKIQMPYLAGGQLLERNTMVPVPPGAVVAGTSALNASVHIATLIPVPTGSALTSAISEVLNRTKGPLAVPASIGTGITSLVWQVPFDVAVTRNASFESPNATSPSIKFAYLLAEGTLNAVRASRPDWRTLDAAGCGLVIHSNQPASFDDSGIAPQTGLLRSSLSWPCDGAMAPASALVSGSVELNQTAFARALQRANESGLDAEERLLRLVFLPITAVAKQASLWHNARVTAGVPMAEAIVPEYRQSITKSEQDPCQNVPADRCELFLDLEEADLRLLPPFSTVTGQRLQLATSLGFANVTLLPARGSFHPAIRDTVAVRGSSTILEIYVRVVLPTATPLPSANASASPNPSTSPSPSSSPSPSTPPSPMPSPQPLCIMHAAGLSGFSEPAEAIVVSTNASGVSTSAAQTQAGVCSARASQNQECSVSCKAALSHLGAVWPGLLLAPPALADVAATHRSLESATRHVSLGITMLSPSSLGALRDRAVPELRAAMAVGQVPRSPSLRMTCPSDATLATGGAWNVSNSWLSGAVPPDPSSAGFMPSSMPDSNMQVLVNASLGCTVALPRRPTPPQASSCGTRLTLSWAIGRGVDLFTLAPLAPVPDLARSARRLLQERTSLDAAIATPRDTDSVGRASLTSSSFRLWAITEAALAEALGPAGGPLNVSDSSPLRAALARHDEALMRSLPEATAFPLATVSLPLDSNGDTGGSPSASGMLGGTSLVSAAASSTIWSSTDAADQVRWGGVSAVVAPDSQLAIALAEASLLESQALGRVVAHGESVLTVSAVIEVTPMVQGFPVAIVVEALPPAGWPAAQSSTPGGLSATASRFSWPSVPITLVDGACSALELSLAGALSGSAEDEVVTSVGAGVPVVTPLQDAVKAAFSLPAPPAVGETVVAACAAVGSSGSAASSLAIQPSTSLVAAVPSDQGSGSQKWAIPIELSAPATLATGGRVSVACVFRSTSATPAQASAQVVGLPSRIYASPQEAVTDLTQAMASLSPPVPGAIYSGIQPAIFTVVLVPVSMPEIADMFLWSDNGQGTGSMLTSAVDASVVVEASAVPLDVEALGQRLVAAVAQRVQRSGQPPQLSLTVSSAANVSLVCLRFSVGSAGCFSGLTEVAVGAAYARTLWRAEDGRVLTVELPPQSEACASVTGLGGSPRGFASTLSSIQATSAATTGSTSDGIRLARVPSSDEAGITDCQDRGIVVLTRGHGSTSQTTPQRRLGLHVPSHSSERRKYMRRLASSDTHAVRWQPLCPDLDVEAVRAAAEASLYVATSVPGCAMGVEPRLQARLSLLQRTDAADADAAELGWPTAQLQSAGSAAGLGRAAVPWGLAINGTLPAAATSLAIPRSASLLSVSVFFTERCVGFDPPGPACASATAAMAGTTNCAFGSGDSCVSCASLCASSTGGASCAVCPGGRRARPLPGFWTESESSGVVVRCSAPAERRCLGWSPGAMTSACGDGFVGARCEQCDAGYFPHAADGCRKCPSGNSAELLLQPLLYYGGGIACLAVLMLCAHSLVRFLCPPSTEQKQAALDSELGPLQKAAQFAIWCALVLQTVVQVTNAASSGLPDFLADAYTALSVFELDPAIAVHPRCLASSPLASEMLVLVTGTAAALSCLLLALTVERAWEHFGTLLVRCCLRVACLAETRDGRQRLAGSTSSTPNVSVSSASAPALPLASRTASSHVSGPSRSSGASTVSKEAVDATVRSAIAKLRLRASLSRAATDLGAATTANPLHSGQHSSRLVGLPSVPDSAAAASEHSCGDDAIRASRRRLRLIASHSRSSLTSSLVLATDAKHTPNPLRGSAAASSSPSPSLPKDTLGSPSGSNSAFVATASRPCNRFCTFGAFACCSEAAQPALAGCLAFSGLVYPITVSTALSVLICVPWDTSLGKASESSSTMVMGANPFVICSSTVLSPTVEHGLASVFAWTALLLLGLVGPVATLLYVRWRITRILRSRAFAASSVAPKARSFEPRRDIGLARHSACADSQNQTRKQGTAVEPSSSKRLAGSASPSGARAFRAVVARATRTNRQAAERRQRMSTAARSLRMSVVERAVSGKGRNQHERLSTMLDAVSDVRRDVPLRPIVGADLRPGAYMWRQLNQVLLLVIALSSSLLLSIPTRTHAGVVAGTVIVCLSCVVFAVCFVRAKPYTQEHAWKVPLKAGSLVLAALASALNLFQLALEMERLEAASISAAGPQLAANSTASTSLAAAEASVSRQSGLEAAVQGMSVVVFVAGCLLVLGLLLAFANILLSDTSCTFGAFRRSQKRRRIERRSLAAKQASRTEPSALLSLSSKDNAAPPATTPLHVAGGSFRQFGEFAHPSSNPSLAADIPTATATAAVRGSPSSATSSLATLNLRLRLTQASESATAASSARGSRVLALFEPTPVRKGNGES